MFLKNVKIAVKMVGSTLFSPNDLEEYEHTAVLLPSYSKAGSVCARNVSDENGKLIDIKQLL